MCGVNTVEYIQNLYKKNQQQCLFKVQPIYENWLFDSPDKMKSRFYKIKFTAAFDQVMGIKLPT